MGAPVVEILSADKVFPNGTRALAPIDLRGSAFGVLAAIQSFGNLAASAIAGALWTLVSPRVAFFYLSGWMLLSLLALRRASGFSDASSSAR